MFGGLEIKSNNDESDDHATTAPAPAAASAFGFLNAGAAAVSEAPAPAVEAASSSFSFMNPATVPAADEPPTAASSGFSFMMEESSNGAIDSLSAPVSDTTVMEAPALASGFSFLIPSPSNDEAEAAAAEAIQSTEIPATEPVITTTGFSFLSSPAVSVDAADPPPLSTMEIPVMVTRDFTSGSAASSVVNAPSPTPPNILETALPSSGLPTGTGITFGTSASRNAVKKKKTRAKRIGAGVAGTPPIPPAPAPAAVSSAPPAVETKSARDEALEAARRAEEFMHSKVVAEAKASPPQERSPVSSGPPDIAPAASTDSVLAAAQKAAEEAKILQQQQQKGGGFMGTFFKGFRASPNTTGGMSGSSNSSLPPLGPNSTVHQPASKRSIPEPSVSSPQRQKPTKQADDGDDDDDMVVVSTRAGGYQPDPVEETPAPAPASTFTPVTLPSTETSNPGLEIKTSSAFTSSKPLDIKNFIIPEVKVPSSLPTPRKSKTPAQIFEEYQALFAQSVHRSMEQVENVRSQQKMLSEERFVSLAKDRLATQQIEQTEQQLHAAVEEEDYELADQLGQVLEGHKREKHEVGLMLENISKALVQLNSQKELVVGSVATCFDNLAVRLEELKQKEAAFEQKDDEETLKQFESISKQLSAEQERLQQDLKHLERDEQLVSEERKELEDAIKEQTGEIEHQKDEATKKLEEVQKEVDELRRQLEIKQKEAADLRTEMFGFEDAISKVRVKFSRQLTRVDKKERALKESRIEWELEDSSHRKQKEAHELQLQSHSEALLAHDALMKTLNSELRLAKEFCELIPEHFGFMDDTKIDQEEGKDGEEGDLAQLQADVVKCEAAVSEAKIILKAATSVLSTLQTERDSLIARIPELEAIKKNAAAKRDFKSASKASKEIKDATSRIKECEEELSGEAASKKAAAEEELARLNEELIQTRELANEKEKVSGIEKMASLAQRIALLVEKKKEICGESSSHDNSVKGVGALVLEGQIKALKAEGQDLGTKYGGWLELMKGIQLGDDIDRPAVEDAAEVVNSENPAASETSPKNDDAQALDDGLTIEERVDKVKLLVAKLKKAEEALETAASEEDFEQAASLQETIEAIASEIAEIDLPEDVLANAVSGDSENEDVEEADMSSQIDAVESAEEEKKDTIDEDFEDVLPDTEDSKDEDDDRSVDDDQGDGEEEVNESLGRADSDDQDQVLENGHTDEEGIESDEDSPSQDTPEVGTANEVFESVSTDEAE
ncbi:UvrB/UvrC motif-containing protein [Nitzschia inconspicua]|uniref:UvrB/UvrC motif-containing protein n=1 Tax=Nitzschia inconspicua TaxID=303405 RepID=A0A9K3PMI6_9STRA|nr:UvrB/UvrC motif-containing protein [Nitzschia inconspicua]